MATEAREICTQIYNDYREVEHFDHVKLMMLAYETGRLSAFKESKELAARPVMRDATVMGAAEDFMDAIREYEQPSRSAVVSNSNGYVMRRGER